MSSACVCHTNEWCFYCEVHGPAERELYRLRHMVEIVLFHHPNVDDPIDYESAYNDLKSQIKSEFDNNPWLEVENETHYTRKTCSSGQNDTEKQIQEQTSGGGEN